MFDRPPTSRQATPHTRGRQRRHWFGLAAFALIAFVAGALGAAIPSDAQTASGQTTTVPGPSELAEHYVANLNDMRADVGLPPLVVDAELAELADDYAAVIAQRRELVHAADLAAGVGADWTKLGENLGFGPATELDRVMTAFADSPTHYANIIDPDFDYIGVGVVIRGDQMWTVHRFRAEDETPGPALSPAAVDQIAFDLG